MTSQSPGCWLSTANGLRNRRWALAALALLILLAAAYLGRQSMIARSGKQTEADRQTLNKSSSVSATPLAVAAKSLTYRVLKQSPKGEVIPLRLEDAVQLNDVVHLEITLPFQCAVYLLYEDRAGSLVWANPKPNRAPQIGLPGQPVRVPEQDGIHIGEIARKQNFLVIYVPQGVNWSLEDAVLPDQLAVKTEDVFVPYAKLSRRAATKLLGRLQKEAEQIEFVAPPVKASYARELGKEAERTLYHRVTIWQTK